LTAVDDQELVIGSRPAAEADLGRVSATAGAAQNVFRKRYRLAHADETTVCARDHLQPKPPGGPAVTRKCPAPSK
jgi:hypothetical protein